MKYIIGTVMLGISMILSFCVVYCIYMAFASGLAWLFVGLGVAMPCVVAWLITSAAFSAVKDY
jgi:hypothetical protein